MKDWKRKQKEYLPAILCFLTWSSQSNFYLSWFSFDTFTLVENWNTTLLFWGFYRLCLQQRLLAVRNHDGFHVCHPFCSFSAPYSYSSTPPEKLSTISSLTRIKSHIELFGADLHFMHAPVCPYITLFLLHLYTTGLSKLLKCLWRIKQKFLCWHSVFPIFHLQHFEPLAGKVRSNSSKHDSKHRSIISVQTYSQSL